MMETGQQVTDLARLSDLMDDLTSLAHKVDGVLSMATALIERPDLNNDALAQHLAYAEREIMWDSQNLEMAALNLLQPPPRLNQRDQRMLRAAIAINYEMERLTDYLKMCSRMSGTIKKMPLDFTQALLTQMLQTVRAMMMAVIAAIQQGNGDVVVEIAEQDDLLSEYYSQLYEELVPLAMSNSDENQTATVLLVIATKIERMGNRIVNIGERVLYIES